jgi:hypothetical protein
VQTPQVVLAIKAIFALTPAFFSTLAFFIAWRFAIDEDVHRAILEGIAQHRRGENAVDPLTGEVLAPPAGRVVDEDTGWFLDHFSERELTRFVQLGQGSIVRDVWLAACGAMGLCLGAALLVASKVTSLEVDPGPIPVLAIVISGFAFAVGVFHLLRIRAARQLAGGSVATNVVRAHLGLEAL